MHFGVFLVGHFLTLVMGSSKETMICTLKLAGAKSTFSCSEALSKTDQRSMLHPEKTNESVTLNKQTFTAGSGPGKGSINFMIVPDILFDQIDGFGNEDREYSFWLLVNENTNMWVLHPSLPESRIQEDGDKIHFRFDLPLLDYRTRLFRYLPAAISEVRLAILESCEDSYDGDAAIVLCSRALDEADESPAMAILSTMHGWHAELDHGKFPRYSFLSEAKHPFTICLLGLNKDSAIEASLKQDYPCHISMQGSRDPDKKQKVKWKAIIEESMFHLKHIEPSKYVLFRVLFDKDSYSAQLSLEPLAGTFEEIGANLAAKVSEDG